MYLKKEIPMIILIHIAIINTRLETEYYKFFSLSTQKITEQSNLLVIPTNEPPTQGICTRTKPS